MGDDRALYVDEDVVPAYKSILRDADIILPNQFEAELLTDIKIDTLESAVACMERLHLLYQVPHVVISSVRLENRPGFIFCCGSTWTADNKPRPFYIEAPVIECYFVGTGDLFAALLLVRLHPFADQLIPPMHVNAVDLPLAKALVFVIASIQEVLTNTRCEMNKQLKREGDVESLAEKDKRVHIMRAAELRLVQNQSSLTQPRVKVRAVSI